VLESELESTNVLDMDILNQYTQAIGGKALLGSVDVFAQQYPLYLSELLASHLAGDFKAVMEHGHKMKGAAGAIGLARLGHWAQYIQHNEAPEWRENLPQFIAKIEQCYQQDIATLRAYLESV